MTKARNRFIVGVAALAVVGGIALEAYRFFDRRVIAREAAQAASTAMASASPATVPDDARRWLEANGYQVIFWNPHNPRGFVGVQESSVDGKHVIVQGQRQVRTGHWLVKPAWLNVTFRFTTDGAFHDVQAAPFSIEIPTTRPAA